MHAPLTTPRPLLSASLPEAQALLAALPVAVLAVDADIHVQYLNPAAEEWLGISTKQACGQKLTMFLDVDARMEAAFARVIKSGVGLSDYDRDIAVRRASASAGTLHVSPVDGGLLLVIDARPHAPLLKEQEGRAEMMRHSGLMAEVLAHEVKNPLSGIRGAAQLLKEDAPEDQQALLQLICDEADRIRDVLAQVEPFSGDTVARPEPINVHEALEYVKRATEAGIASRVRMVEDYDTSLPFALASRNGLVQVLMNIITNAAEALEHTPDPQIRLITTARQEFRLRSSGDLAMPNSLHILVEDNGPGVPSALQAQMFEPYISSKRAGRGLGLAIAAKIMAEMGGHVLLESSQPGFTRFRITLPVAS